MGSPLHLQILELIKKNSGTPTQHTLNDSYLGNDHPRYPINNAAMRKIAKEWMRAHQHLPAQEFMHLLTSLIEGPSCTEKMMAGFLLEYASKAQRDLDPMIYDTWLNHLVGWVEIDTLCTGSFVKSEFSTKRPVWKKLVKQLSSDVNINKRRASLVLFCSPLGHKKDDEMAEVALRLIDRLKHEKDILITKAISWLLRTMTKHHRDMVSAYLEEKGDTLPRIALRETLAKLETGRKTKRKA